eukprot:jgi/Mesvir1/23959/Mv10727-RA.2
MGARVCSTPVLILLICVAVLGGAHLFGLTPSTIRVLKDDDALRDQTDYIYSQWAWLAVMARDIRVTFISPILQALVGFSAFLSALVAADRLFHFYLAFYWKKCAPVRPEAAYSATPLPPPLQYESEYPMVVVQIPMFNERDVCEHVIDACCELQWPRRRLLVQVLDDSTCEITRQLIDDKVSEWREKGVRVENRFRDNRQGYKAGAMLEAMQHIQDYEFVAIFDADFRPDPDFLLKTIPYLKDNAEIGFVQTRWIFANADESMLTRVQEISLNYHIKCEQFARFASGNFFNFNGTAGVWRRACIEDAGNWNNRTTVEDMDLSLRAFLRGWKFIFLHDVECICELPSSYEAYRKQQHRWTGGPMQLWRKAMASVWDSKIPFVQKLYLNMFFFGTRLFATHVVSFVFYCTLVPICIITPEVTIPFWALIYVPILVTMSTAFFTPRAWYHMVHYVLFENAMSVVKIGAMCSGLLNLASAHQWVVTTKLGNWVSTKAKGGPTPVMRRAKSESAALMAKKSKTATAAPVSKIYKRELFMSAFLLSCAIYGVVVESRWEYSVFLILQGIAFGLFGLNFVDNQAVSLW